MEKIRYAVGTKLYLPPGTDNYQAIIQYSKPIKLFEGLEYRYNQICLVDKHKFIESLKNRDDEVAEAELLDDIYVSGSYDEKEIADIIHKTREYLDRTEDFK